MSATPHPASDAEIAALRESEAWLRQCLESLPQLLWAARPDGAFDYLSPQWVAYTGLPIAEQPGLGWLPLVHEADRAATAAVWRAAVAGGQPFEARCRLRAADGSWRWFAARGQLLRDEAGQALRWYGSCTDVDALQGALAELSTERDRLARLASAVPVALHTLHMRGDGGMRFPFGAERVGELLGVEPARLRQDGSAIIKAIHPDDEARVAALVAAAAAALQPWHAEYRVRHPQVGERWIEGRSSPVPDGEGGIHWHGALTDITDRKRAEEALAASRAQLASLFAHVNEGLVLCSPDGLLFDWNPAALRLHGFATLHEAVQPLAAFEQIFELRQLDGTLLPQSQWPLARALRGEPFEHQEVRLHHRHQGWERVLDYGGTLALDAAGKPVLAIVHFSDATERHRAAAEVQRLNAELEQRVQERTQALSDAVKELEAFSYSVSHDLRAPLRALDGFSLTLLHKHAAQLAPEAQRYLGIIRDSVARMGQLIDDLLAFSQVGRVALKRMAVDPNLLVRDAIAQLAPALQGRQIQWQLAELPACEGDLALLRQVWINLLSNAVKYSRGRTPALIEVGASSNGGRVTYHVRDNGAGFDMRHAHRLFGVFERLHGSDEFEGTGVGLAIVQRIVQRHGGGIRAEAVPGQGAAFFFDLGGQKNGPSPGSEGPMLDGGPGGN